MRPFLRAPTAEERWLHWYRTKYHSELLVKKTQRRFTIRKIREKLYKTKQKAKELRQKAAEVDELSEKSLNELDPNQLAKLTVEIERKRAECQSLANQLRDFQQQSYCQQIEPIVRAYVRKSQSRATNQKKRKAVSAISRQLNKQSYEEIKEWIKQQKQYQEQEYRQQQERRNLNRLKEKRRKLSAALRREMKTIALLHKLQLARGQETNIIDIEEFMSKATRLTKTQSSSGGISNRISTCPERENQTEENKTIDLFDATHDMETLIQVRRQWDQYLVKSGEGGSRIPTHFVIPSSNPTEEWKKWQRESYE